MPKPSLVASEKLQEICNALRRETLEPARLEAQQLIDKTTQECRQRLHEAQEEAERIREQARAQIRKEQEMARVHLQQAVRQALASLREAIEGQVLQRRLVEELSGPLKDPDVIARLIQALATALERDGLATNLEALIAKTVEPRAVNQHLAQALLEKLRGGTVEVGRFEGGMRLKLCDQQLTVEVTDSVLQELLAAYLRRDFRDMLFQG